MGDARGDTLIAYASASGPAGLRLVPDLALALPRATDGGTVYTFRLRPGIRYSDGQPLRAGDFRRAIERQFLVGGPVTNYFTEIVGAARCSRDRCDLSRGIVTDDARETVSFRLSAADPDFPAKLAVEGFAAPIPAGIPDHDVGRHAVPATGPYRIVEDTNREVRFVRNPFFAEWSHAAQPAGNPDAIVWRFPPSLAAASQEVQHGEADWANNLAPAELSRLEIEAPSRVHVNPTLTVEFLPLNSHLPPFNDVRVRRALDYAIDRAKIVRMYGGPLLASPLCQPLAPGMPGYHAYCPYTLDSRSGGAWTAPDLAKARRLVTASGTTGERVTIWGSPDEGSIPPHLPAYIASVLRSLGYRIVLRLVPSGSITPAMRQHFQLSVDGDWLPDFPSPSSYLPGFFGCHGALSNGYVCNPGLDRQMQQAIGLQVSEPPAADALWRRIDHEITDEAYWVPMVNLSAAELTSTRLRNYEFSPVGDFIADQAWLR